MDCSSRTTSRALPGLAEGLRDIALARIRSRAAGTSARPIGCTLAWLMRLMRSADLFAPPGTSNGDRPASSEYTVAANDQTSLWTVHGVSSSSTSGAVHGMDIATVSWLSA